MLFRLRLKDTNWCCLWVQDSLSQIPRGITCLFDSFMSSYSLWVKGSLSLALWGISGTGWSTAWTPSGMVSWNLVTFWEGSRDILKIMYQVVCCWWVWPWMGFVTAIIKGIGACSNWICLFELGVMGGSFDLGGDMWRLWSMFWGLIVSTRVRKQE